MQQKSPNPAGREAAFREGISNNRCCRREVYINLLGGESEYCAGCDVCEKTVQHYPRGAYEIMKLLRLFPRFYNRRQIQFLLAGRGSRIIRDDNLCRSRYFKRLSTWEPDQIGEALGIMQREGIVRKISRGILKGKLDLTAKGIRISGQI